MKKAILFDMDGLMIDSERVTWEGYQAVCPRYGFTMEEEFYLGLLGNPIVNVIQKLKNHFGEAFPAQKVIQEVHEYMELFFEENGVPKKPGLIELLEEGKRKGYQMLVATSSDRKRVDRILESAGITDYFAGILCGNEVEHGKPAPDIFLKGCEKLGVQPQEAYVIEDSEAGILAASRAGIDCICVPDMKEPETAYREKAWAVVDTLLDVIPRL